MSLQIASLNSGSNGNCYYIGNSQEAVLIDAGLTCRETEKRMRRLNLPMNRVKALFISHEHGDHIRGTEVLAGKYQWPVYITPATLGCSRMHIPIHLVRHFQAYQPVEVGKIAVHPFPKLHDATDPHSFMVSSGGINIGVFTDIGTSCEHLITHFKQCHAALLETNYDHEMLMNGRYPIHLKKRISGGHGHLSNEQALELFLAHRSPHLTHLLLSHLSKENNHPQLALNYFAAVAGTTSISIASRDIETELLTITGNSIQQSTNSRAVQTSLGTMSK